MMSESTVKGCVYIGIEGYYEDSEPQCKIFVAGGIIINNYILANIQNQPLTINVVLGHNSCSLFVFRDRNNGEKYTVEKCILPGRVDFKRHTTEINLHWRIEGKR